MLFFGRCPRKAKKARVSTPELKSVHVPLCGLLLKPYDFTGVLNCNVDGNRITKLFFFSTASQTLGKCGVL